METMIAACVLWTLAMLAMGHEIGRYRMAGRVADAYEQGGREGVDWAYEATRQGPLPELGFERGDDNCYAVNPSYARRFNSPWLPEMP